MFVMDWPADSAVLKSPFEPTDLSLIRNWRTPKLWPYCPQTLEPVVQT
jgi:hypothetical protein